MGTSAAIKLGMNALAKARADALFAKEFAELNVLPELHAEQAQVLGKPVTLTVFRSPHDGSRVLIVVQAFREALFGMTAQISVEGFVASPSGEKVRASEEMLWDYN